MNENIGNIKKREDYGHLLITQKKEDKVVIFCGCGERIIVQTEAKNGGQVKVSFYAPKSIKIVRGKVLERQQREEALK